jgi:hypothetical protein
MTENGVQDLWRSEDPLEELESALWCVTKATSAMTDEEELRAWEQAVAVLHDFGKLAETLHNDPLLLVCTDAMTRAEEELTRVHDRLSRPEGERVHWRERERLEAMIKRSDALSNAYHAIEEQNWKGGESQRKRALEVLREMGGEVDEQFDRYRVECGIPEGLR